MTNTESTGSAWLDARPRLARFYRGVAPILVVMCLLASLFASTGVFWLSVKRSQDQQTRNTYNTSLLQCFDKFATQLSGSLPPVRIATAARDRARDAYDKAAINALTGRNGIGGLLLRAQAGTPRDPDADLAALIKTFAMVDTAAAALDKASAELNRVRAANPYPPPPSTFCDFD